MKYQKEICAYLQDHRADMVRDLCALAKIRSVKGEPMEHAPCGPGPAEALDAVEQLAAAAGLKTGRCADRVVYADANNGPRQLEIFLHMDVVDATPEGWSQADPFIPEIRGDRIYGRGVSDNKGPVISAVYAIKALQACGAKLGKNVRLVFGSDEEKGGTDLEPYLAQFGEAPFNFVPDAAFPVFHAEKSRWLLTFRAAWKALSARSGVRSLVAKSESNVIPGKAVALVYGLPLETIQTECQANAEVTGIRYSLEPREDAVQIVAEGIAAHSASAAMDDPLGNNALTGLLSLLRKLPLEETPSTQYLNRLADLFPHGDGRGRGLGIEMEDSLLGRLSASLNQFEMDENGLWGCCDCRLPICATENTVLRPATYIMEQAGFQVEPTPFHQAHYVSPNSALVKTLLSVYESCSGKEGYCVPLGGGTYASHLRNAVAFGIAAPGVNNRAHATDEFVLIDDILFGGEVFAQAILAFCGQD